MDQLSSSTLSVLRSILAPRAIELRARIVAYKRALVEGADIASLGVTDQKDQAERSEADTMDDLGAQRAMAELGAVQAALDRMDCGDYNGDCQDCGQPIGVPRLLAVPQAIRCARCQDVFEAHQRRLTAA